MHQARSSPWQAFAPCPALALVAAALVGATPAAAQPLPAVRLSVSSAGAQGNGPSTLLEVTPERPDHPVHVDGEHLRPRRHQPHRRPRPLRPQSRHR